MVMSKTKIIASASLISVLIPATALAHCPLCTAGAGLVFLGAYWIGVNGLTIGVLMGALALAFGLWMATLLKKKFVPQQDNIIGIFSWATTLIPLQEVFSDYTSIYIDWGGDYGTLFNRTYPLNLYLVGGIVGGLILYMAPWLSRSVSQWRGKTIPFQGMIITFVLLILTSLVTQFLL